MNRVYRGYIFNRDGEYYVAENSRGVIFKSVDEKTIMREIDRLEYNRLNREPISNKESKMIGEK